MSENASALPEPRAGEPGKWRKRPIVIDAFCLGVDAMPDWFCDARSTNAVTTHNEDGRYRGGPDYALIKTLEGEMRANNGDWIIRGVKGELYPCKPDIFAATYEPAVATSKPQEGREPANPLPDWMVALPCAMVKDRNSAQGAWLYIPHADGQWVSAAKLAPFSLAIIDAWRKEHGIVPQDGDSTQNGGAS